VTSKTRRRRSDTSGTRFLYSTTLQVRRVPEVSLHRPPGARSSRPVPHAPPTLARSGHPVGCHATRIEPCCSCASGAGERRASQQHGPRRAPPTPSLLTPKASNNRLHARRVRQIRRKVKNSGDLLKSPAHQDTIACPMPERIKPKYDFGPCRLNRASIERITALITEYLPSALFTAEEGIWETYDENRGELLKAIAPRKRLDAFRARAEDETSGRARVVELAFTPTEASLTSTLSPVDQDWLEHLIIDVRKALLRPSLPQRLAVLAREGKTGGGGFLTATAFAAALAVTFQYATAPRRAPYSRIILNEVPPSPFIANVKANLVSNLIWLLLGIAITFLVQWLARKYQFDPGIFGR